MARRGARQALRIGAVKVCLSLLLCFLATSARAGPELGPAVGEETEPSLAAPPDVEIQALEQRLATAIRYIQQLHGDLNTLKRKRAEPITPEGFKGTPLSRRTGTGPNVARAPQVAAGPTVSGFVAPPRRPQDPSKTELLAEQAVPTGQEVPDLGTSFLRQARAVLLRRGRLEIEPTISLSATSRSQLLVQGLDIIEAIFIGDIRVERVKRTTFTSKVEARYGLTDRLQIDLTVPYVRSTIRSSLPPAIQRESSTRRFESRRASMDLGDIQFGTSYHLLRESDRFPDLIVNATLKTKTGRAPWDVDRNDEVASGSGFWGLSTGGTLVKVLDPAVMFATASYRYAVPEDDVPRTGEVAPGDSITWGLGLSYALNPELSLTTRFQTQFVDKTEVNGRAVDGSDLIVAMLTIGGTYRYRRNSSLQFSFGIGLTDDSPDFIVEVSMPLSWQLPPLSLKSLPRPFSSWRFWRDSRTPEGAE